MACTGSGSAIEWLDSGTSIYRGKGVPGTTVGFTGATIKARSEIELLSARPARGAPGDVEIVAARVNFLQSETYDVELGTPGGLCLDRWPPKAWGPRISYPLAGTVLAPGDVAAITLFLRSEVEGRHEFAGLEVEYIESGARNRSAWEGVGLSMVWTETPEQEPEGACVAGFTAGFLEF